MEKLLTLTRSDLEKVHLHILNQCEEIHHESAQEVLSYFFKRPGKGLRSALLIGASKMFQHQSEKVIYLAACIEFIHGASLLHDDVIDMSNQRRGQIASHEIFGNKKAILVGDLALVLAQQNMNKSENWRVIRICTNCLKEIIEGQIKELRLTGDCQVSWLDYEEIISKKTASLFRDSCLIGAILANSSDKGYLNHIAEFGMRLGMVFQMIDDSLDYSPHRQGKTLYSDFLEGKVTGPIILAYHNASEQDKAFLSHAFLNPDLGEIEKVLDLLDKLNCLNEMKERAKKHAEKGIQSLKELPQGEMREAMEEAMIFSLARQN